MQILKTLSNPCQELIDEDFRKFGPESTKPCVVCGCLNTRSEPRFNYSVCVDHFHIPPVTITSKRS